MCNPKRPNAACSKLSDYDNLCGRVSEHCNLKGFYRAFISTSTQWLSNLFNGICMNAKIINMRVSFSFKFFCLFIYSFDLKGEVLYDKFEEIFQRKPPQNEILDVQGFKPQ